VAIDIRRREFVAGLGGTAAWPLFARAQQAARLPTIGFLSPASPSSWNSWTNAFTQRLRELGWIEGHTVAIEYRWAEGRSERFAEFAAEFVRLKVDVIVTAGSAGAATKQATSTIPIVLAVSGDPVGDGFVMSLARPGGNITGLSLQQEENAGKRIELLREVVPHLRRFGVMFDAGYRADLLEVGEVETTARTFSIEITRLGIRRGDDIAPALETLKNGADALYVCTDALAVTNRLRIGTLTLAARLPMISGQREDVEVGGLMSYGPDFPDLFRRAAGYVDKILKGAKPGDLPVEQPTKFELVINLKTAKALGLTVSQLLLAQADQVIE
jgi:putative tryptophan/tyrosine transport system substrate-binding protein